MELQDHGESYSFLHRCLVSVDHHSGVRPYVYIFKVNVMHLIDSHNDLNILKVLPSRFTCGAGFSAQSPPELRWHHQLRRNMFGDLCMLVSGVRHCIKSLWIVKGVVRLTRAVRRKLLHRRICLVERSSAAAARMDRAVQMCGCLALTSTHAHCAIILV